MKLTAEVSQLLIILHIDEVTAILRCLELKRGVLRHAETFNPLTPNDHYSGRTASLTSKRCNLYIYSTNILNTVYTLRFFSLQNAVCFISLTYFVPVLFTFCIKDVLKLKKNNSGAKRLKDNLKVERNCLCT